jgi:hypothetical protein
MQVMSARLHLFQSMHTSACAGSANPACTVPAEADSTLNMMFIRPLEKHCFHFAPGSRTNCSAKLPNSSAVVKVLLLLLLAVQWLMACELRSRPATTALKKLQHTIPAAPQARIHQL